MMPLADKGILAPPENSVLPKDSQRTVFFADLAKEQYPKTDILHKFRCAYGGQRAIGNVISANYRHSEFGRIWAE